MNRKAALIKPFNHLRVKHGSYELSLSREVITTLPSEASSPSNLDESVLTIPPGEFSLLYTEEEVIIPNNVLAFISIKASIKLNGLVNISGFHVDPGYRGHLKFSVFNAGPKPIFLDFGEPTFLIWFGNFEQATVDPYDKNNKHWRQERITPHDRQQMAVKSLSAAALNDRLTKIEQRWAVIKSTAKYGLIPLAIATGAGCLLHYIGTSPEQKQPPAAISVSFTVPSENQAASLIEQLKTTVLTSPAQRSRSFNTNDSGSLSTKVSKPTQAEDQRSASSPNVTSPLVRRQHPSPTIPANATEAPPLLFPNLSPRLEAPTKEETTPKLPR